MRLLAQYAALLILFAASSLSALTVDELIAKNIEARGGLEKIQAIRSIQETGKLQFGGERGFSATMSFASYAKRPDMLRTEATFQGMTAVNAYDGSVGWRIFPFRGRLDPEKLSADDLKELQRESDMDGPLVNYKGKGNVVEYLGTEDVDGTDAHKLKVTLKNGDVRYIYLDPDYFLEIRYLDQSRKRGAMEETETDVGNYEQINGVYFPFSIETGPKGQPKAQKITIEKVEVNVDINDSLFHFPATAAKTGK
jgi:outer membrane lipoprotein-sorting protein